MLKICMVGAMGRMGQAILYEAMTNYKDEVQFVSGVDKEACDLCGTAVFPSEKMDEAVKDAEVTINFTHADAEAENVKKIANAGKDIVIGTTGLSNEQLKEIETAIYDAGVSAVIAPNFSPLVNTQMFLAKRAAQILAPLGYDFGIIEEHHTGKKDSPSGTAKALARSVIEGDGPSRENYWKEEKREKQKGELDMGVMRLGGSPGQHEVRIVGKHGRLVIETLMYTRADFAKGAIEAAVWLKENRKPGKIFEMRDILKLE